MYACVWGVLILAPCYLCVHASVCMQALKEQSVSSLHHSSGWEQVGEWLWEIREAVIRE